MHAVTLLPLLSCILLNGFLSAAECWPRSISFNFSASTSMNSQLQNLNKPASEPACTDNWHWLGPGEVSAEGYSDSCSAALRGLMSIYRSVDRQHAFMASGTHNESLLPHVQTPITYESGNGFEQCTVAVALLIDLPMDWVPDAPRGPYLDFGVSTWGAIEEAGRSIICKCLLHWYEPARLGSSFGWMATPQSELCEWSCSVLN